MNRYAEKNITQLFSVIALHGSYFKKLHFIPFIIAAIVFCNLTGCASNPVYDIRVNTAEEKDIFVFIDGTGNTAKSQTNVRRMYEMISFHTNDQNGDKIDTKKGDLKNKSTVALYIQGVGDPKHPVTGTVLGKGASQRIEASYAELMKIYTKGDHVYIFGFSRGANFARALAGLISYAGIPQVNATARTPQDYYKLATEIHGMARALEDKDYQAYWSEWSDKKLPPMAKEIEKVFGYSTIPVAIKLLGVWDTVPGSFKKKYGSCMEEVNDSKGTRYKTNSYPTIKRIAHALAIDEKRDRFQPLHVCEPINPQFTVVEERWFPGAHSDVGGGFLDGGASDLPNLSLSWMFDQLTKADYIIPESAKKIQGNALGIAHWTDIDTDFINDLLYDCVDRDFNSVLPGAPKAEIDKSYRIRKDKKARLRIGEFKLPRENLTYPISCAQFKNPEGS